MYDAIVVGARCAGASTAMLLGRKGYNVLLVDRAPFPSDLPHGHFIHRGGPARLARWGLLDRVIGTGCPPVTSLTIDNGDFPLTGRDLAIDGVPLGCGPRRSALDQVLVDAAVEAGVEFRAGFHVDDILADNGRVTGIRGRTRAQAGLVEERAHVTIGADGRGSRLARSVRAPITEGAPGVTCWYFSYWSGVPGDGLEIYLRGNRVLFGFPTNSGLFALFGAWPRAELSVLRVDIEGQFMAVVDQVPDLAERIRSGRREDRFFGATELPNFLRKPYGPGWALVGDAGCHKDPYLALGICDAFRDAELLADAVDDGLSGTRAMDAGMAAYERQRDEMTLPEYRRNLEMARFLPLPPETVRLRAALRGDQAATNQFCLAAEGMIPQEAFFNPANLQRLMARA